MESSGSSSTDSKYDDGVYSVYEKLEEPPSYPPSQGAKEKGPKLPTAMLACLAMLLVSCFVGILLSGLHFGHKVVAGDCLAQSWVMFSVRVTTCSLQPVPPTTSCSQPAAICPTTHDLSFAD